MARRSANIEGLSGEFFFFVNGDKPNSRPWVTMLCHVSRKSLVRELVKEFGMPWDDIRKDGGRVVKCRVTVL
jgi:hypothetical protein